MDAGDLEDYEDEFDSQQQAIEKNLSSFDSLTTIEKSQSLKAMKKAIQEMRENAKSYKQAIFEMHKSQEKNLLAKHQTYVDMINGLESKIKDKEKEFLQGSEEKNSDDDVVMTNGKVDYNKNTSQQVIQHGYNVQDKSKKKAEDIHRRVEEMKGMAQDQIVELDRQEDVILKINDANEEIDSELKKAQKYLKYFARTYMQDK